MAPLVTYLASPAAERINGEVFVVPGGVELAGRSPDSPGFATTETMSLATETIGFD